MLKRGGAHKKGGVGNVNKINVFSNFEKIILNITLIMNINRVQYFLYKR